jgi:hypothetical protein
MTSGESEEAGFQSSASATETVAMVMGEKKEDTRDGRHRHRTFMSRAKTRLVVKSRKGDDTNKCEVTGFQYKCAAFRLRVHAS